MVRLMDEIMQFLTGKGFHCHDEVPDGLDIHVISVDEPARKILPIEIGAKSTEEAMDHAAETCRAIEKLKLSCGSSPLVIPEDRWRSSPEMMKGRLLAHLERHLQIYARNCTVRRIEKSEAAAFLHETHSYGDAACRYRYGLFFKRHTGHMANESSDPGNVAHLMMPEHGQLIAAATFSNARKWKKGEKIIRSYEWTRYASLPGIRVNGGMGRLLKTFIKEVEPDDIMSYADLEWSEGAAYEQLGFIKEGAKSPVCFKIDTCTWKRSAANVQTEGNDLTLFYMNFGSAKYRLKLTDYE